MAKMIALKPFAFKGRMLAKGEEFTITEPSAKLLVAIKRAAYFKENDNVRLTRGKGKGNAVNTEAENGGQVESTLDGGEGESVESGADSEGKSEGEAVGVSRRGRKKREAT